MPSNTRIIQKPPGLTPEQEHELHQALEAALGVQKRLAHACPFVLRPLSELRECEVGWSFEHEPAEPLRPDMLFLPAETPLPAEQLLSASYAVFEALRCAQEGENESPVVHGAICPGVVLIGENGAWKVSDFGFLAAFASVLGMDAAIHLAVGPPHTAAETQRLRGDVSAVWCLLPPGEADRDDRICAFIDPEKYAQRLDRGGKMPREFGPKSDVISAGFVLHLLAEHHHPYFYDLEFAHRIPEMAEMTAGRMPTTARRKDLRESDLPGIREWCAIMPRILSHISDLRPSAADVAMLLAPFVEALSGEVPAERFAAARAILQKLPQIDDRPVGASSPGREPGADIGQVIEAVPGGPETMPTVRPARRGTLRSIASASVALILVFTGYFLFFRAEQKEEPAVRKPPPAPRATRPKPGPTGSKTIAPPAQQDFNLVISTEGRGTTTPPPGSHQYPPGKKAYLHAEPEEGWHFKHWKLSGARGDEPSEDPHADAETTMDRDKTVTAVFEPVEPPRFGLTVEVPGGGGRVIREPEAASYESGGKVVVKAQSENNWRFDHWEGDIGAAGRNPSLELVMDRDKRVQAFFVRQFTLNLVREGDGTLEPPEGPSSRDAGTEVLITAKEADGWHFDHWEPPELGRGPQIRVTLDADKTVKAVFVRTGWPPMDAGMQADIRELLVRRPPLEGCEPEWIKLESSKGRLIARLVYPWAHWPWAKLKSLDAEVPFAGESWPKEGDRQPEAAAQAISQSLEARKSSDPLLTAVFEYLRFWKEREQIEADLAKLLPAGTNGPVTLPSGQMSGYLTRLARIKWRADDVPEVSAMEPWTAILQDVLEHNHGHRSIVIEIRPTRFIEYFWGPKSVHALYWIADAPGGAAYRYARLGDADEIGQRIARPAEAKGLGETLLGPIVRDGDEGGGSFRFLPVAGRERKFGLVVAPDGPLCFVSILALPVGPIRQQIQLDDADEIGRISSLGQVSRLVELFIDGKARERFLTAYSAAWIMVSLGPAPVSRAAPQPQEAFHVPWEVACATIHPDRELAPVQALGDFVPRAFNGDVICFKTDAVKVRQLLENRNQMVKRRNPKTNVFDAGFLGPRLLGLDGGEAPWFAIVAHPIAAPAGNQPIRSR